MLAELSSDFSSALTDSQSSSLQQVQDLTDRLQQVRAVMHVGAGDAISLFLWLWWRQYGGGSILMVVVVLEGVRAVVGANS